MPLTTINSYMEGTLNVKYRYGQLPYKYRLQIQY